MNLNDLLSRRLVIVSGKGGVGKTTVVATLGLIAAQQNKKTLLVEINSTGPLAELFDLPPFDYQATELSHHLSAINVTPKEAFKEYILKQIHSRLVYRLVFENRLTQNFLEATPGLSTLLEIGKIWSLVEEKQPQLNQTYDLVIVDAPATGHLLSLLRVPKIVTEAIKVGPLKNQAQPILELLSNSEKTLLTLVCLPEEMPVNETLELVHQVKTSTSVALGPIFMNALLPRFFSESEKPFLLQTLSNIDRPWANHLKQMVSFEAQKVDLQRFYLQRLKENLPPSQIIYELPFLFEPHWNLEALRRLSSHLQS